MATYINAYNAILGRMTLNKLGVVGSTPYLLMKFFMPNGIDQVWAYQKNTWQYYMISLKVEHERATKMASGMKLLIESWLIKEYYQSIKAIALDMYNPNLN